MNFDEEIERRGTHSLKWDKMNALYGVDAQTGLAMWVADMDFRPPQAVQRALEGMTQHGLYGYFGDESDYRAAICWWMKERHGWSVAPDEIFTTHGVVNGTAMCIETFTRPGDGIVLFTPVYHAFARVIRAAGREVIECPLAEDENGRYHMDFDAYNEILSEAGNARMVISCSPHNPGGTVWTSKELETLAGFVKHHDLLLVSDEIHHDLIMPGHKHTPMALINGVEDRLLTLSATTKTFNIAGTHCGNVIIQDRQMHEAFAGRMAGLGLSPNSFGLVMATAAYSTEGAAWLEALMAYIHENRKVFDEAINTITGLRSMPLEATYLAWVDFAQTGLTPEQIRDKIAREANIAASDGTTFGRGGETWMRFNLATPRARIIEAGERLAKAFS